jgi:hypothetical protein
MQYVRSRGPKSQVGNSIFFRFSPVHSATVLVRTQARRLTSAMEMETGVRRTHRSGVVIVEERPLPSFTGTRTGIVPVYCTT